MNRKYKVQIDIYSGSDKVMCDQFVTFPVTIGRSNECSVCLESFAQVSGCHAKINTISGRAYLVDQNSFNGTMFEGKKITKVMLVGEQFFFIGDLVLKTSTKELFSRRHKDGEPLDVYEKATDPIFNESELLSTNELNRAKRQKLGKK